MLFRPVRAALRAVRRHPWIAAAAALLLVAAGAFAGLSCWNTYQLDAARTAMRLERWDEGRRHLNRVWWPQREAAELLGARLERLAGNSKEAEAHLNACKELRGDTDAAIQLEWLLLRAQTGEIDKVAPGLWNAINQGDPEAPAILEALIRGYVGETRFLEALNCVVRWLELEPDSARALYWRGRVRMVRDNQDGAQRDFARAVELEPEFSEARLKLAILFIGLRNGPAALEHLEILKKELPDSPAVLQQLAQCQVLMGQTEVARRTTDALFRIRPEDANGLALRGALEWQDSKPGAAEPYLRRAIKAEPTNVESLHTLYLCLRSDPARKDEAAAALATWQRVRDDMEQVTKLLHERIQTRSDTGPDVAAELAWLYLKNGNERVGMLWINLALRRDPAHQRSHQILADYYTRTNRPALAAKQRALAQ